MGHESFDRAEQVKTGSDRVFGLVFAVVFALIGVFPWIFSDGAVRVWALAVGAAFLAIALAVPRILHPLNRLWMRFGLLLHRIVNPVVLGIMFFVVVTPIALLMRWRGKDPLRLRFDAAAKTYWIARTPPGPDPRSLNHLF
jgi:hypothetical protein